MAWMAAFLLAQDLFPLGEGHAWTYEVDGGRLPSVTRRVTGREKVGDVDCFKVEDPGFPGDLQRMWVRAVPEGIRVERLRRSLKAPVTWLRIPLDRGATWSAELRREEGDDAALLEFREAGEEQVETPAGTWTARRVDVTGREDGKQAVLALSSWYAPGVGEVKRTIRVVERGKVELDRTLRLSRFAKGP